MEELGLLVTLSKQTIAQEVQGCLYHVLKKESDTLNFVE